MKHRLLITFFGVLSLACTRLGLACFPDPPVWSASPPPQFSISSPLRPGVNLDGKSVYLEYDESFQDYDDFGLTSQVLTDLDSLYDNQTIEVEHKTLWTLFRDPDPLPIEEPGVYDPSFEWIDTTDLPAEPPNAIGSITDSIAGGYTRQVTFVLYETFFDCPAFVRMYDTDFVYAGTNPILLDTSYEWTVDQKLEIIMPNGQPYTGPMPYTTDDYYIQIKGKRRGSGQVQVHYTATDETGYEVSITEEQDVEVEFDLALDDWKLIVVNDPQYGTATYTAILDPPVSGHYEWDQVDENGHSTSNLIFTCNNENSVTVRGTSTGCGAVRVRFHVNETETDPELIGTAIDRVAVWRDLSDIFD